MQCFIPLNEASFGPNKRNNFILYYNILYFLENTKIMRVLSIAQTSTILRFWGKKNVKFKSKGICQFVISSKRLATQQSHKAPGVHLRRHLDSLTHPSKLKGQGVPRLEQLASMQNTQTVITTQKSDHWVHRSKAKHVCMLVFPWRWHAEWKWPRDHGLRNTVKVRVRQIHQKYQHHGDWKY